MPLDDDRDGRRRPSLKPTSGSTLFVAGLAAAALSWLAISRFYGNFQASIPWLPGLTLLALAGLEFAAAVNTKARIDHQRGTEPVDPLLVARYVVLAKASALAAALFTGLYAGLVAWLATEQRLAQAEADLPPAVVGLVGSAALIGAALALERACRVPPPPSGGDASDKGWAGETAEPDPNQADS
jgi:hypothetical protein